MHQLEIPKKSKYENKLFLEKVVKQTKQVNKIQKLEGTSFESGGRNS